MVAVFLAVSPLPFEIYEYRQQLLFWIIGRFILDFFFSHFVI